MRKRILSRLAVLPLTLLVVSFAVFALTTFSPGDSALYVLGEDASEEALSAYREASGSGGPFLSRYLSFLLSFLRGDWGTSAGGRSVRELVAGRAGVTLSLALMSLFLALLVALPLSFLSLRKGTLRSALVAGGAMAVMALPSFLIALFLVLVFSVWLGLFPVAGYSPVSEGWGRHLSSLFLPSLTLALMHASLYIRVFRQALRENSEKPYSKAARALGMKRSQVLFRSALKPSLPVLLSLVSETFASALAGSAVVETVFALPGLGSLLVTAALSRDPVLSGTLVLLSALAVSLVSLLLDLSLLLLEKKRRII